MSSTNWITAQGEVPDGDTNFVPEAQRGQGNAIVGGSGLEVRTDPSGNSYIVENVSQEHHHGRGAEYSGSVIATARTVGGGAIVSRPVHHTDLVSLPGMGQTTVAAATSAGLLTLNADGSYADVTTPETLKNPTDSIPFNNPQENPEDGPQDTTSAFTIGEAGEEAMTALVESVPQGDMIRVTDEILQLGAVSENTLARIAGHAGIEPEAMAAQIEAVHSGFYETATAHLADHGVVNEDAFQAYLGDNPHQVQKLLETSRGLMTSPSASATDGLTDIADAFVENGDIYMPEDVKAALEEVGFDYIIGDNHRILVMIDGMPVPWHVAVRQRLIKFL